jgi:2-dehydro-3-deoxy-D-arabinonate dehydratase
MKLYKTSSGWAVQPEIDADFYFLDAAASEAVTTREDLFPYLTEQLKTAQPSRELKASLMAPMEDQEIWAAGVTYFRSREARMSESKEVGGGDFYRRVYGAQRPELFFKATKSRVAAPGTSVHIRRDSRWNVPEPELALLVSPKGTILGYTIGNDMSSRDIEGENPLYLPQAKVYDRCCSIGPGILVASSSEPLSSDTKIELTVLRTGKSAFNGTTTLASLKRRPGELVEYLLRDNIFPHGAFLLTGTGIIPPDEFTLQAGDEIQIDIDGIGSLRNHVA